ncbi:MAG: prefoldin subunit [Candidatus Nanoarchaeia archaeon]|nr:prefoldin subunit [Candidatus Nanoarchaeia archaeon]MDD5054084.1 prefoldin subunit [Candidatus Nanoarchaeia archaeon]MDD5499522.1 prefoldin subunit [Candidatus Nanoarchaeia archaeon]
MAIEIPKGAEEEVAKLQQYQQQYQMLGMQKQNIQNQLIEMNHSLEELKKLGEQETYEIVGAVMIKKGKEELIISLSEKMQSLELRDSVISKQIDKIYGKMNEAQEKVMKMVKGGKK